MLVDVARTSPSGAAAGAGAPGEVASGVTGSTLSSGGACGPSGGNPSGRAAGGAAWSAGATDVTDRSSAASWPLLPWACFRCGVAERPSAKTAPQSPQRTRDPTMPCIRSMCLLSAENVLTGDSVGGHSGHGKRLPRGAFTIRSDMVVML